jgi:hypothetical protein
MNTVVSVRILVTTREIRAYAHCIKVPASQVTAEDVAMFIMSEGRTALEELVCQYLQMQFKQELEDKKKGKK